MTAYVIALLLFVTACFACVQAQSEPELAFAFAAATKERLTAFKEGTEKLKNIVFSVWGENNDAKSANSDPLGFHLPNGNRPSWPYSERPSKTVSSEYNPNGRLFVDSGDPSDPLELGIRKGKGYFSKPKTHGNSDTPQSYVDGHLGPFVPGIDQGSGTNLRIPKGLETGQHLDRALEAFTGRRNAKGVKKPTLLSKLFGFIYDFIWHFK